MASDVSKLLTILATVFLFLHITLADDAKELYVDSDSVSILTSSNFADVIYNQEHGWLVEFYNKWCGHCVRFAPTWKELGKSIRGRHRFCLI